MRWMLVAVATLVAAGCAPGSVRTGGYAGMDRGEARVEVFDYLGKELRARDGPLRHHDMSFVSLREGKTSEGDDAWVGRFTDRTAGSPVCIRVRKTGETIVSEDFDAEIDDCSLEGGPPPPPAA